MKQRIIFFGSGDYSIPVVQMLNKSGLELVVTTEIQGPLIDFLVDEKIPHVSTKIVENKKISKNQIWEKVEELNPTLGVLASFGAIIPQKIIDLFQNGIWNIHPSLLPKFKGPSPIQFTILSGVTETGVSIISLDDQVDHGPILAQEKILLRGDETSLTLKAQLFSKGAGMIHVLLQDLENDRPILKINQEHKNETWTEKISKEDGRIDIKNPPPPEKLQRMIRAYYPWPTVMFEWEVNNKKKLVKLLPDNKIQIEGKNIMHFKDFINGYGKMGIDLLEQLKLK